jgi:S1-C subfamily serine protease
MQTTTAVSVAAVAAIDDDCSNTFTTTADLNVQVSPACAALKNRLWRLLGLRLHQCSVVARVRNGSAAAAADLRVHDVLLAVNTRPITTVETAAVMLAEVDECISGGRAAAAGRGGVVFDLRRPSMGRVTLKVTRPQLLRAHRTLMLGSE